MTSCISYESFWPVDFKFTIITLFFMPTKWIWGHQTYPMKLLNFWAYWNFISMYMALGERWQTKLFQLQELWHVERKWHQ